VTGVLHHIGGILLGGGGLAHTLIGPRKNGGAGVLGDVDGPPCLGSF
jgi:hypothetical protein